MKMVHQIAKFDKEIVEEYLEKSPDAFCPYCRSTNFENTSAGGSIREMFVNYECKDCNKMWVEYYENTLTDEEHCDTLMKYRDTKNLDRQTLEREWKSWKLKNIYPDEHLDDEVELIMYDITA